MLKILFVVTLLCGCGLALNNGLARTPPMGWLAWERFRCNTNCKDDPNNCISENLFKQMADRMVDDGFRDAGYEYVNIDDCWSAKERDAQGRLQADPDRFPNGIKGLADYIHSKGLKLGIYADYGNKTCAGYPGSLGHMEVDAQTFADWGVDMLKMDGCNSDPKTMKQGYPMMTKYLNQTGRPILFSCSWPDYERAYGIPIDYQLVAENCNIWRNYDDISDSWDSVLSIIDYYAKNQDTLTAVAGPGNFNDPDMLIIGDFGLSYEQSKAQMAMWTIFAAPMLMSNDLRNITPQMRELLQNKEVIQISQDKSGHMGKRVLQDKNIEIWTRNLTFGEYVTVILNRDDGAPTNYTTAVKNFGYQIGIYDIEDGFTDKDYYDFSTDDTFSAVVNPSGVVMLHAITSEYNRTEKGIHLQNNVNLTKKTVRNGPGEW